MREIFVTDTPFFPTAQFTYVFFPSSLYRLVYIHSCLLLLCTVFWNVSLSRDERRGQKLDQYLWNPAVKARFELLSTHYLSLWVAEQTPLWHPIFQSISTCHWRQSVTTVWACCLVWSSYGQILSMHSQTHVEQRRPIVTFFRVWNFWEKKNVWKVIIGTFRKKLSDSWILLSSRLSFARLSITQVDWGGRKNIREGCERTNERSRFFFQKRHARASPPFWKKYRRIWDFFSPICTALAYQKLPHFHTFPPPLVLSHSQDLINEPLIKMRGVKNLRQ